MINWNGVFYNILLLLWLFIGVCLLFISIFIIVTTFFAIFIEGEPIKYIIWFILEWIASFLLIGIHTVLQIKLEEKANS